MLEVVGPEIYRTSPLPRHATPKGPGCVYLWVAVGGPYPHDMIFTGCNQAQDCIVLPVTAPLAGKGNLPLA